MRTGQLVVRMHSPWQRRRFLVLAILGAIVFIYGVYEWGRFDGGYNHFAEIQRRREFNSRIEALEHANEKLRAEIAAASVSRNVDRQSYSNVEKSLADLQAQVLKQREELTFYRGIVSPEDGIGGLRVQKFQILSAGAEGHYRLRLVLLQSMRQDSAVSGSIKLEVEGVRGGQPAQLSLADLHGTTRADGELPFSFRYFQDVQQNIEVPVDFQPRAINVEVRSPKFPAVRESFPWQVQPDA